MYALQLRRRCVQVVAPLLSGDRINDIRTRLGKIKEDGERGREGEKGGRVDRNKSGDITGDKARRIARGVAL